MLGEEVGVLTGDEADDVGGGDVASGLDTVVAMLLQPN